MYSDQEYELTILPGTTRDGKKEGFDRIVIRPGDTLSIVGPTGSGKSAFINDIEILAQEDTVTGRRILVNGGEPSEEIVRDPARKPIALITQNTRVLADLTVTQFLSLHLKARNTGTDAMISCTIELANEFTGEKIDGSMRMTGLSGGQTRSLLIADAILIGQTPILLLDEVENAGINKERVITCLREYRKAVIFVTHDPYIALITDRRIVMKNGAVFAVLEPDGSEGEIIGTVSGMDSFLWQLREKIRSGDLVGNRKGIRSAPKKTGIPA
ncbi:ATP-binding cassette domain-containing protein [Methanoregula sp.]|uniref:ATP-binding cassette domain-containing protein n=1 Tax=Methanoregula sp. TaxID=2052170 RepID=UPI002BD38241|nr:ATP-binding cassette domain-containing protein [Methanoregula sp.]HVP97120.1 ATP-binding cassette domain-containing protein [Methanoregula sp.]